MAWGEGVVGALGFLSLSSLSLRLGAGRHTTIWRQWLRPLRLAEMPGSVWGAGRVMVQARGAGREV